eukprot:796481-Amphidinium_carterae.1
MGDPPLLRRRGVPKLKGSRRASCAMLAAGSTAHPSCMKIPNASPLKKPSLLRRDGLAGNPPEALFLEEEGSPVN